MKGLQLARKVLLVLAAVLAPVLWFVGDASQIFYSFALTALFLAGIMFHFVKNNAIRYLGIAFVLGYYSVMVAVGFAAFQQDSEAVLSLLIPAVSLVLYGISWILQLAIVYVAKSTCKVETPEKDPRISAILKWKELADKKIITEAEFIEKRNSILNAELEK